jgi:hypothetical protein
MMLLTLLLFSVPGAVLAQSKGRIPADQRAEYREFEKNIEKMISTGREAAANQREQSDLRTLEWLLREFKKQVAAGDSKGADQTMDRMNVALQRSRKVVADAPRRKAERERAEAERRHREEMNQRRQHHRELMNSLRGSGS